MSDAKKILLKYPDRIPVLVNRAKTEKTLPIIDRNKYLVPRDLTVSQFLYVIRKRIKLKPSQAIFLFVKNLLPPGSNMMGHIYETYRDGDYYLRVEYAAEEHFG